MASLYQLHVEEWRDCQRCELASQRSRIVLARGSVPCDVLLVGEAPGVSEDTLGKPFMGPAGKLLDEIMKAAWEENSVSYALTNLVACFPREAKNEGYNEPPDDAIKKCAPRLEQLVKIANPRLIVAVGTLARDWLDPKRRGGPKFYREIPQAFIVHPSAILRANLAMRSLMIQRCVVTLANAVEKL